MISSGKPKRVVEKSLVRPASAAKLARGGILLVDKPEGPSSAEVVRRVKAILQARKAGHLGTLDPFASGLLPLGINEGTKIADIFLSAEKSYCGVIALGVDTDTQDSTGRILEVREVPPLSDRDIGLLQQNFTGRLLQTPPMFSALKKEGVRLYRLARQGRTVPRAQREVQIERLKLWREGSAELRFEVTCSKGTYVRTLAADMGKFLGCGAHLKSLRRTACGHLTLDRAVTIKDIGTLGAEVPLLSLNEALAHLRELPLEGRLLAPLRLGQQEVLSNLRPPQENETMVRLVDSKGDLFALAQWVEIGQLGRWRLFRVFAPES